MAFKSEPFCAGKSGKFLLPLNVQVSISRRSDFLESVNGPSIREAREGWIDADWGIRALRYLPETAFAYGN
jgi:hypothetical protein